MKNLEELKTSCHICNIAVVQTKVTAQVSILFLLMAHTAILFLSNVQGSIGKHSRSVTYSLLALQLS